MEVYGYIWVAENDPKTQDLPILLRLNNDGKNRRKGRRGFKFRAKMW